MGSEELHINIPEKILNWLLEDNNPPVRNLTKQFLLDIEPIQSEIDQINDYPPISSILSFMKSNGSWSNNRKPYKKYTGDYWQLIFLGELLANSDNSKIDKAIEHIFSYQLSDGSFPHELESKRGISCLTANLLKSFIHFGYEKDKRVQKGIDLITQHIVDNKGIVCYDPLYLLPDCQMALTKVLAMYASLKDKKYSSSIQKAILILENKIKENNVLYYVPKGSREFHKRIRGKKIAEIRQIKSEFANQPELMKKTEIKSSWQRFGFPNSYTTDALETLYWLSMIGVSNHPNFDKALDIVEKRKNSSGYWINEISFRNPMLVDIEPKKSPSKWLTFRAYHSLVTYGRI